MRPEVFLSAECQTVELLGRNSEEENCPDDMQTNELIPGTGVSVNSVSVAQNGFDIKRGRSKCETTAISFRRRDTSLQTRKLSFCVCCLLRRVLFYLAISLVETCQLL